MNQDTSEKRSFNFNKIIVIESLKDNERETGQNLYNDLLRWKDDQLENLECEYVSVANRIEFFTAIEKIHNDVITGEVFPFIHLEMHGSIDKDGLVLSSLQLITWEELASRFRAINVIIHNNLVVSLATCFGGYIYSQIKPTDRSPFWGFIGPWETVGAVDIEVSFNAFFETLLNTFNFDEAIIKLNEENNLPFRYAFYNSEMVFERVYSKYEAEEYAPGNYEKRVFFIMGEALKDFNVRKNIPLPQLKEFVEERLIADKASFKEEYKKNFLMLDLN